MAHRPSLSSKYQILCNISIRNWVVGTSSDSRWRACRISISKTWLLTNVSDFWCWFSISMMQKFDWRLNCGSNYGFLKIWFLTNGSPQAVFFHLGTKFGAKCWSKFKMAAVCHLGIVKSPYRTTHEVCVGLHKPVKFYANPIHSFEDMWIWILDFLRNWPEMPIHAPKFRFLGSGPLNVIDHRRDPQKAHLHLKLRVMSINSFDSVHICDL